MSFGILNDEQRVVLSKYVVHEHVWDVGAGDMTMAVSLCEIGASKVWAVEPHVHPDTGFFMGEKRYLTERGSNIEILKGYVRDVPSPPMDDKDAVIFVSWPVTHCTGLCEWIRYFPGPVIYLGNTFDGTMCGAPCFWNIVTQRVVADHIPDRKNSLIAYEPRDRGSVFRPRYLSEEKAALDQDKVHSYPY
jgi:hypothetical protein